MSIDTTKLIEALEGLLEARRVEPGTDEVTPAELERKREETQRAWDAFDAALERIIDERVRAALASRGRGS